MSIFSETMITAISHYRMLLRRHLTQVERMNKLHALKLKDSDSYASDVALYQIGIAIVKDMQENMQTATQGYYTYSGISEFCNYLKEYLEDYYIENEQVIHRAQKASRALMTAIQLSGLPREQLTDRIAKQFLDCNTTVAGFGSTEQCELQLHTLMRQQANNPGFYTRIIAHLESLLLNGRTEAAA
jgi:hypothetical protein